MHKAVWCIILVMEKLRPTAIFHVFFTGITANFILIINFCQVLAAAWVYSRFLKMHSLHFSCDTRVSYDGPCTTYTFYNKTTPAPLTTTTASTPTSPVVWSYVANGIFVIILMTILAAFLTARTKRYLTTRRAAATHQQYDQLREERSSENPVALGAIGEEDQTGGATAPSAPSPTSSTMSSVDLESETSSSSSKKKKTLVSVHI